MSTIGVAGIDRVAQIAARQRPDVILLDAPVSGSNDPAERGELTIFASGAERARARRSRLPPPSHWPRRLGLPTQTVIEALHAGPLVSGWQAAKTQRISDGDLSAQFAPSLALKDVGLALEAAGNDTFPALAGLAAEWQGAVDHGLGGQDLTVVTHIL